MKLVPTGSRRRLASIGLLVASTAVCIALAEAAIRVIRPGVVDTPARFRIVDPVLGWRLRPSSSYEKRVDKGSVSVTINSSGWRDVERSVIRKPGVLRIVVLGDSFVEANSVNLDDSFPRLIEDLVSEREGAAEVLNFGVGGFGTLQEFLVYTREVSGYRPDIVLLGFCVGNDLRNNSRELESLLAGSGVEQLRRPFLPSGLAARWQDGDIDYSSIESETAGRAAAILRKAFGRSAILSALRRLWIRVRVGLSGAPSDANFELAVHGVNYCETPPEYERAWETTAMILRRLRDEVRQQGAELVVFTEPTLREVDLESRERIRRESDEPDALCLDESPGTKRLVETLRDLQVPLVDLLSVFRGVERPALLFRRSDQHWNEAGHRLVADELVPSLEGLIEERRREERARQDEVQTVGPSTRAGR